MTVRLISSDSSPPGEDVTHLLDTAGEVQVKGPNIFTGYWDDEEVTKKEFVVDEKTGERWFKVSLTREGGGDQSNHGREG